MAPSKNQKPSGSENSLGCRKSTLLEIPRNLTLVIRTFLMKILIYYFTNKGGLNWNSPDSRRAV